MLWLLATEFREKSDERVEALVEDVIDELTTEVGELEDLVRERLVSIAPTLDTADLCVECPRCRQSAVTIGDGLAKCAFCLWRPNDGMEGAAEYAETVLGHSFSDGYDPPIHPCLGCGAPAMVEGIEQLRPDPQALKKVTPACDWQPPAHYACFECGYTASEIEVNECRFCQTLNTHGEVCGDCLADIISDRD